MKRFSKIALIEAAAVSTLTFQSCTDLEETIYEEITSDNFFSSEGDYYSVLVTLTETYVHSCGTTSTFHK